MLGALLKLEDLFVTMRADYVRIYSVQIHFHLSKVISRVIVFFAKIFSVSRTEIFLQVIFFGRIRTALHRLSRLG